MDQETLKLILSALVGGLFAPFVTHILAFIRESFREKQKRMTDFKMYLAEIESIVERTPDKIETKPNIAGVWDAYIGFVHEFHRERIRVIDDFVPKKNFDHFCTRLGRMKYDEAAKDPGGRHPRDVLKERVSHSPIE